MDIQNLYNYAQLATAGYIDLTGALDFFRHDVDRSR
jgi:hypothetical protein